MAGEILDASYASAEQTIDQIYRRVEEVLSAWETVGKSGAQAASELSGKMLLGLNQYQQELDVIAAKLEMQRSLVFELQSASQQPSGAGSADAAARLESETLCLKELELQFDRTYAAQRDFILEQDKAAQALQKTAAEMDLRKAGANAQAGANLAATGLGILNQVAPGVVGSLDNIITQIGYMRQAMTSEASTPMKWATGIGAALSVAVGLVASGIQKMKEEEEKRQRLFEESVQKMEEYTNAMRFAEQAMHILDDQAASTDKLKEANELLANTFPDLIVGYTEQGEAILASRDAINEYMQAVDEKNEREKESILLLGKNKQADYDRLVDSAKRYGDQLEQINSSSGSLADNVSNLFAANMRETEMMQKGEWSPFDVFGGMAWKTVFGGVDTEFENLNAQISDVEEELKEYYSIAIEKAFELKDVNGNVIGSWKDMSEAQKAAANEILLSLMDDLIQKNITLEEAVQRVNEAVNDESSIQAYSNKMQNQAALERILEESYSGRAAAMGDLTGAYQTLAAGGKLEEEQIQRLANTYPVIKEYLQETGDLALQNGAVLAEAMNSIDYSQPIGEIEDLQSAFESLAGGKAMDAASTYELVQKYPELAAYLAQTGDLTFQNGQVLADLVRQKNQAVQQSIQDDIAQLEQNIATTQGIITNCDLQIAAIQAAAAAASLLSIAAPQTEKRLNEIKLQKDEAQKNLDKMNQQMNESKAALAALKAGSKTIGTVSSSKKTSSKANSTRNEAYQAELKQMEHKKKMAQLSSQEELSWLERLGKKYRLSADEKMDLEYRIYSVRKKLQEEAEKAAAERLNAEYKAIENKKSLDQLTYEEELAWLQKIQKTFQMNAEQRAQLEIKIYNLKKQLQERDAESLNTIGDAVTEALRNQYEQQQAEEEKRIDESIQSWKTWEEETCAAIQGQIDALDELEKQQESEEKRREYENKRQAAELQLKYEKDDYNRRQIEMQIAQMEAEEQKRLEEEAREEERRRLEEELEAAKETSSRQQEALEKEKEALSKQYEELLSEFNLRAQAERAIMESSQKEILELIQSLTQAGRFFWIWKESGWSSISCRGRTARRARQKTAGSSSPWNMKAQKAFHICGKPAAIKIWLTRAAQVRMKTGWC